MDMSLSKKWIAKWVVPGSKRGSEWVVAINNYGEFGCSCPVWKFKRQECKHILRIRMQGTDDSKTVTKQSMETFVKNSAQMNASVENDLIVPQSVGRSFNFND